MTMAEPIDELQAAFRTALGVRAAALEAAAAGFQEGQAGAAASIRRMAHALRGVGGTYGFPEVSEAAAACEDAPDDALLVALDGLRDLLKRIAAEGSTGQHTVLLVEDDLAVSELVQMVVRAPDRRIYAVQTTMGARMVIEDHLPDLILLDLILPDADGRMLLARFREDPRTADVPILVITGLSAPLVKTECLALGADDFLLKPLDPRTLAVRVSTLLERRPLRPAGHGERPGTVPPRAHGAMPPAEPATGSAHTVAAPPGPVLLAEDDELTAAVITHRLVREGLEVRRYADGAAALAAAQARAHALVILDVKMPAMDGFELLQRLRALPAYATTPILMLTSMGSERDIARGFELGADDYMVKPFSPVEVVARVNRQLRR
jgi:DNA-binding response OmpR family regulator